jgi:hypothetical protein
MQLSYPRLQHKDGKSEKTPIIVFALIILIYTSFAFVIGTDLYLVNLVPDGFIGLTISYGILAFPFYLLAQRLCPDDVAFYQSRMLHELAKRKLIQVSGHEES